MKHVISALGLIGLVFLGTPALAGVEQLAPVETALLPDDGSGVAKVAVRFDVEGLGARGNVRVAGATLEWTATNIAEFPLQVWIEPIDQTWQAQAVAGGTESIVRRERVNEVILEAGDHSDLEGALRMDLGGTLEGWLREPERNFGVIVASSSLAPQTLASQVASMRLMVRYSLVRATQAREATDTGP